MKALIALTLAVLVLPALPALAQPITFGGPLATSQAIPDGTGYCVPGNPLTLTVNVTGIPSAATMTVTIGINHTWYSDLKCVLRSPTGASTILMVPYCEGTTYSGANLAGLYTLSDSAATYFDTAALNSPLSVAPGSYRPDNAVNGPLFCGVTGTWTVTFQDYAATDIGSVNHLALTITPGVPTATAPLFTICQTGPGAPVNLIHAGSTPNGLYFNPAVVNTPSSIPLGWFYGLAISFPMLVLEINYASPIFSGFLNSAGNSVVSVPGLGAGYIISIVGVHFSPTTGQPVFSTSPVNYTII